MSRLSNIKILEKAISKATDNGWVNYEDYKPVDLSAGDVGLEYSKAAVVLPHCMIFHHSFAKALWANEPGVRIYGDAPVVIQPAWSFHLQQMVIADDPIKYLGENI